jgi:AraC family transcriptional regulator of adaptative response / DNA-3-methyladenine glycosylase II
VARCRRIFDLDADPVAVDDVLGADPDLRPLVTSAPGRRVPGVADPEELAVRAVLGQQVSVASARAVAGRLVSGYGEELESPVGRVTHVFPGSADLAAADPAGFPMPASRQRTLHELTARLADGRIRLDPGADRADAGNRLLEVPGIGPWTAGYVRMRALGDPDVFLPTDLGVRHGLHRLGHDGGPAEAERLSARWRPWRSYALMHIWTTDHARDADARSVA